MESKFKVIGLESGYHNRVVLDVEADTPLEANYMAQVMSRRATLFVTAILDESGALLAIPVHEPDTRFEDDLSMELYNFMEEIDNMENLSEESKLIAELCYSWLDENTFTLDNKAVWSRLDPAVGKMTASKGNIYVDLPLSKMLISLATKLLAARPSKMDLCARVTAIAKAAWRPIDNGKLASRAQSAFDEKLLDQD